LTTYYIITFCQGSFLLTTGINGSLSMNSYRMFAGWGAGDCECGSGVHCVQYA